VSDFHQIFSLSKSNTVMIWERKYFHKRAGEWEQSSTDQKDIPWTLCCTKQTNHETFTHADTDKYWIKPTLWCQTFYIHTL